MSVYSLYLLVGAAMVAPIGAAIAVTYNRIKADTNIIISLVSTAVVIGWGISSIWASFENNRALERHHTQLESVRVRIAELKKRADANGAALLRVGKDQRAGSTPDQRQQVLELEKDTQALAAESRALGHEIHDIGDELGQARRAKETRALWRTLVLAVALLPLVPLIYRRRTARQRAIEERN